MAFQQIRKLNKMVWILTHCHLGIFTRLLPEFSIDEFSWKCERRVVNMSMTDQNVMDFENNCVLLLE